MVKFPTDSGKLVNLLPSKSSLVKLVKFPTDSGRVINLLWLKLSSVRFVRLVKLLRDSGIHLISKKDNSNISKSSNLTISVKISVNL